MTNINELRQRMAVTLDKFGIPKEPVEDWDFESKQATPSVGDIHSNKGGLVPTGGSGTKEDPHIIDIDALSDADVAATGSVRDRMYEVLDDAGEDYDQYRVNQVPIGSSDMSAFKSPIDAQNPGKHIADIKLDKWLDEGKPKIKNPKYPINISKLRQRLARIYES